jgi:hypothetical protein
VLTLSCLNLLQNPQYRIIGFSHSNLHPCVEHRKNICRNQANFLTIAMTPKSEAAIQSDSLASHSSEG